MTVLQNQPRAFTTLPREFYLEGPLFEAEMRRIWHREWLYLGRVSEIPDPGDFIVRQVVGESVLLVRTADEIVGLLNVCRHRGARIVDGGCGNAKRFTCPYHQWTFDLDGRLRGAPSMPDGEEVDYEALGMYRVPVEIWSGFVFGSVGGTAPPPLSAQIEELAPRLSDYAPEHMRRSPDGRMTVGRTGRSCWKIISSVTTARPRIPSSARPLIFVFAPAPNTRAKPLTSGRTGRQTSRFGPE
jgi:phenylpropionate dioxygenase-like ring-hydroxylating dioxygenase large terminal subunit